MEVKSRANISSLARLAIAREKTRIKKQRLPSVISELEQAAERWQNQKELAKRGISEMTERSVSR